MTDDKQKTSISSDPVDSTNVKSRSESRASHAATSQPVQEQTPMTRANRKAEAKPALQDDTPKATRKQRHATKEVEVEADAKPVRWVQIRILPIYVRVLLVLVLLAAAVVLGAFIGFSILGDGAASDIFHKETWTHIFDIMNGKQ
ncbi:DNA-directed RNA polymerase subunit beta [Sporosarcina sp. A2]|uniref:DNA-directed RNA polymerase subunit beta n=1 Tax=Sporosarcina sp. A2 TaxID=3393449 RepID=UPI003D7A20DC